MVTDPDKAFVMGGTYRIPVIAGLQDADFIDELKKDGSYNEATFSREYESVWTGSVEGSFFDSKWIDDNRELNVPEYKESGNKGVNAYYVLGVDVGRRGDQTEITVIKARPHTNASTAFSLVNIESLEDMHFEDQALIIKRMYNSYKPKAIVIDGNGVGAGLVDYLVRPTYDRSSEEWIGGFGVINDDDNEYKRFRTSDTIDNVLYIIKANAPLNTEMHSNLQNQLRHGRIKFLVDENVAKGKLLATQVGKKMTPEQRGNRLKPYNLTTVLKMQLMNLVYENDGVNIILKQANKSVKKDKVSSLEMALYWIHQEESRKKRRKASFGDMIFHN